MNKNLTKISFILILFLFIGNNDLSSQVNFNNNLFTYEDTVKSLKFLSGELSKVIIGADLKKTKYSLSVFSLDNNRYYFKKNSSKPLTPASLTKIFTCFSALYYLGNDFVYNTAIYYTGKLEKGIIYGDVYLVGSGDPLFNSDNLRSMVNDLKNRGIKEIHGDIIADASIFDELTDRLVYSGDKDRVQRIAPITGLSINKNIVKITVKGITRNRKKRPIVITDPPSPAFLIKNSAKVTGRSKSKKKRTNLDIENSTYGGSVIEIGNVARRKTISIKQKKDKAGNQYFTVSGRIKADNSYSYSYYILKPVEIAAGSLYILLKNDGIKITGTYKVGTLNRDDMQAITLAEFKRDIADVISPTLKNSDNYLAENIFKLIGASSGNMIENAKETKLLISNLMDSIDVNYKNCSLNDGSGLSRRNKLTSNAIIKFISQIWNSDKRTILDSTLSLAGQYGTLKNRMKKSLAEGNLKGKTGTHKNVSGLCGIIKTLDGENLAFCFMFNGWNIGLYKRIENRLGIILSEFFYFNKEG